MTPSTSLSNSRGRGGPGLAVIDTPPTPPGWEDARAQLVRIVDPLGRAVAWLAPASGGRCVGFAVRPSGERGTEWVQVFHSVDPPAVRGGPRETGCGVQCALAAAESGGATRSEGVWQFVERDPTTAMLATTLTGNATGDPTDDAGGDPAERNGGLHLRFSAALDDGALTFTLVAETRAAAAFRLHLGLQLALSGGLLSDATGSIRADLPGRPIRQDTANTRTGIPPNAVVGLGGFDTPIRVEVTLIAGVSRLCYCAPGEQGVVALLASAGASPAGMLTVEAGATFGLAVAIRVVLD